MDDVRYGRQLASPALIYRFNQLLIAIGPKTVMCTAPTHSPLFVYTHMPGYINECTHTHTHMLMRRKYVSAKLHTQVFKQRARLVITT